MLNNREQSDKRPRIALRTIGLSGGVLVHQEGADYFYVEFPVKVNDYNKREKQNQTNIKVLGYGKQTAISNLRLPKAIRGKTALCADQRFQQVDAFQG